MILERFFKDEKGKVTNILEDSIREISINDNEIKVIRNDGSENIHLKNNKGLYKAFLLNNEGKTLKRVI